MHSMIPWSGTLEIEPKPISEEEDKRMDEAKQLQKQLEETQQSWLLGPQRNLKKERNVDLGCVICKPKVIKWIFWTLVAGFVVVGVPIIISKFIPKHTQLVPPPDEYTVVLHKALLFFNAQKSGRLPKNNKIKWRRDSALKDGIDLPDVKGGLVGGYYDAGDNIKFHYPMAFSMTLLSWSVIEYCHKYKAIGEYNHILEIIRWGTDYLMKTFNSSATTINKMYIQVGIAQNGSKSPNDEHYCWMRPEDIDYHREVMHTSAAPDLGSEVASALAAASIAFRHDSLYSNKLISAAKTAFRFATDPSGLSPYSYGNAIVADFYNSSGFYDEFIWGATWMFYATGNYSYISQATNLELPKKAKAFVHNADLSVFSWDNKLPAADLLLTRFRIFLNPGYPYEELLKQYHATVSENMCFLFKRFHFFNMTKGGLINLNHGRPQPLQYVVNAAFLAILYADYMNQSGIPGWYCGVNFMPSSYLREFAASQVDYILGKNPKNVSYIVGYGNKYPKQVHHRAASIPHDHKKYSCTEGWKWRDSRKPNPNAITGAMVGGPDKHDRFIDDRHRHGYTEPTLAGNAGLVAALVALTGSGGREIDRNALFVAVQPLFPPPPPPPSSWIHS